MNMSEAKTLTEHLMDVHIKKDRCFWNFEWMTSTRALGKCNWKPLGFGSRILLNEDFVLHAEVNEVTEVILHEIAHVLAGPMHGHDRHWSLICIAIGGHPSRLTKSETFEKVVAMNAKYVAVCGDCGDKHYAARLGRRAKAGSNHCGPCVKRHGFNDKNKLTWRINY